MEVGILTNGANMRHLVVVRFQFEEVTPERLDLFRVMLESLENQSDKNFQVIVFSNPEHDEIIQDLTFLHLEFIHWEMPRKKGYIAPFDFPFNADILTRIDCDDFVSEDFIEYSNSRYNDESVLYAFVPNKIYKGREYRMGKKYHEKKTPMFLSLTNPKVFIFKESHLNMWKYADRTELVFGKAWMNVHDNNALTKMKPNDTLI